MTETLPDVPFAPPPEGDGTSGAAMESDLAPDTGLPDLVIDLTTNIVIRRTLTPQQQDRRREILDSFNRPSIVRRRRLLRLHLFGATVDTEGDSTTAADVAREG